MNFPLRLSALSALCALSVLSCSDSTLPAGTDTSIQVLDDQFSPQTANITPGTTVTWTWAGNSAHSVTSDDGAFTSSETQQSGTHAFTFSGTGIFHYHCVIHGTTTTGMRGTIVVRADSLAIGG